MRRATILVGAPLLALAACSASSTDFQKEGEKFLESDTVSEQVGYSFTDATCQKPDTTRIGTQYTCTAVDNEGDQWEFTVEVTGDSELTVVAYGVVG